MKGSSELPVYQITVPINGPELTLSISGDFHYGHRGITKDEILRQIKKEQNKYRNNIFRIYTGDLIENNLTNSIGHGYDLDIPDPSTQREDMTDILKEANENLYGKEKFKRLKISPNKTSGILSVGCCGNHEYRSRKASGIWLDKDMYNPAKIMSIGLQGIIELTIVNRKLKLSRTYNIFISHRPGKTSATSLEAILRACKKKKGDIPGMDIFVFGHFHKRIIEPDIHFDKNTGKIRKMLYVINPSPLCDAEYAEVAGYSPLEIGYKVNCFLPLDEKLHPYGIV